MSEPATEAPIKQFPCQQCGAKLEFAPGTALLKCKFCGFENPIPQSEADIEELDFEAYLSEVSAQEETRETLTVKCASCGAESTLAPNITSDKCPFCGTGLVAEGASQKTIKPKALLPFKFTQGQALGSFRAWIGRLWFAPGDLKRFAESDSRLQGVYLPHWTYDCGATSFYRGERGDDYWTTEMYTTLVNGKSVTRTRSVKRTRWTSVSGTVWNDFNDVLIVASNSLPRAYADQLEPWDLKNLVPYSEEYLSGFKAESYRVGLAEGFALAKGEMDPVIRETICGDIGGDHQRISTVKTRYSEITFKHLLLPVWISAYRFREKVYRIMINARTGEVQGERPYSWMKITLAVLAGLAVVAGIVAIVAHQ